MRDCLSVGGVGCRLTGNVVVLQPVDVQIEYSCEVDPTTMMDVTEQCWPEASWGMT